MTFAIKLDDSDFRQMPVLAEDDTVVEHPVAAIQDGICALGAVRGPGVGDSAQQKQAGKNEHGNNRYFHRTFVTVLGA